MHFSFMDDVIANFDVFYCNLDVKTVLFCPGKEKPREKFGVF